MLWNESQLATTSSLEPLASQKIDFLKLPYPQTIAFVDPTVYDATALASDLQVDAKFILDPNRDGIAQITEILGHYQGVTGVDIIAHGNTAELQLGNAVLSASSLQNYAQELQQWKPSLATGADILFYACNVAAGAAGQDFVRSISTLTGADIAASTDLTGDAAQGGNWDLEYTTGQIETAQPFTSSFISSYHGILPSLFTTQTPVLTNFTDGTGAVGDYELGMEFSSAKVGQINAIRYYKAASETGVHVGRIWSSTGVELAKVTFSASNDTGSGWKEQALATPLTIAANTTYVVSTNVNTYYVATSGGIGTTITNGDLSAVADGSNGVFNFTPGLFPTQSFKNTNYFRDIVFTPNSPPTGNVTISGTATEKQTLTAANTLADADGLGPISYQWQVNTGTVPAPIWTNIGGATATTFTPGNPQVGKQLRVLAGYTDGQGKAESVASAATAAIVNVNDPPTGIVTISGTTTANQILTAANTLADADGLGAISYQWQVNTGTVALPTWTDIGGAIGTTFTLSNAQVGKQVRVLAGYTDGQGTVESVASAATTAIANINNPPTGNVTIAGIVTENQTLTAANTLADADGLGAISYQWQVNNGTVALPTWTNIGGATGTTFTLGNPQSGKQVRVLASYTDGQGTLESVASAPTSAVVNVNDPPTGSVSITGTATEKQTLTAANTLADADGLGAISYQWQVNTGTVAIPTWTNIVGATATTFTLGNPQVGKQVRVLASYTDGQGTLESVASAATSAVVNVNDPPTGNVTIAGTAIEKQTLTAANTLADADGLGAISYQWQVNTGTVALPTWTDIGGATGSTFTLSNAQVGKQVRVLAAYVDGQGTSESVASAATAAVAVFSLNESVFAATATPVLTNLTDGAGAVGDYELGMEFSSLKAGKINAIRYFKAASETGPHVGRIWSSTGTPLASVTFSNETGSGWQEQALASPLNISANTTYVVSVNNNTYYVATSNGIAATITNGDLSAVADGSNGVFNFTPGLFPTQSYNNTNYFRDVVFTPTVTIPNNPGAIAISGTPTQNQVLTADVTDVDGTTGVTINYQWQQSSNNGTTWTNIAGATNKTITLAQAQVGSLVRSTATYTDALGNSENVTSAATTAVVNVNDVGTVVINGNAVTGNTLTAAVNDPDGLNGVAIAYKWQQSSDGNTWGDIAAATSQSLSLDNSLVGKQVRVNAVYTDALGTNENVFSFPATISALSTLYPTTATPNQANFTDGPGVDWEYGTQFSSKDPGEIRAIRYYKAPSEDGAHIGNIWSSTGQLLASVAFTNETASGWQQQDLTNPVFIDADATYVVSVNTNGYYAVTSHGFDTGLTNGSLTAPVGAGVYNETEGAFPSLVYFNENYYRDVVFVPGTSIALKNNDTIFVSESDGFATVTAVRKGSTAQRLTVEYTTNEIGGAGAATAGADFIQPSDVRPNTGLIVFEVGETEKTFKIPIVNDNLVEGTETFAVGLQNTTANSLGTPRTVLISILDDDSPATISMSNPTVSVSEQGPTATITVQRSGNISNPASVSFSTSDGTALAGSDYIAQSGIINFAARQLTQTISIPIVNDTIPEGTENFTVTLSNPTNAVLGSQIASTVTILDNDLNLGTLNRQVAINGLNAPTAFDWTPDGRYMLVAQKDGEVRVVDNGILRTTPLIDLSSQVNDTADRGLLGIAINPNFATNPYVYLLYTYDPPETQGRTGLAGPDGKGNRPGRLVRVTVNPTTMIADPASLVILAGKNSTWAYTSHPELDSTGDINIAPSGIINGSTILAQNVPAGQIDVGVQDNDPTTAGIQNQNVRDYLADDSNSHSIGAVHFGSDGYLYLTVGDGTSYNFADPRAVRVQDISNLSGKLLRIDPVTGAGVPGNPFYDANDPNSNKSKVFYSGVRNAFRFTFDPVTKLPVLGDVGWNTWEEINTGAPGSNFGWPYFEGPDKTGTYQNLAQAITFYNNGNINPGSPSNKAAVFPILSRKHGAPDNATAIMVGDFYNGNTLMFGDVNGGSLYAATLDSTTRQVTNVQVFDSGITLVVDMEMGPDGFLYGVDIATGQILRWNPA